MLFERFEDEDLSQFSYAVGCPGAGKVAIVDPRRDIDLYVQFAAAEGLQISHVLETHIHADFASGARELAALTGAQLLLSAYDEGEFFDVAFDHIELADGDRLDIGNVTLQAVHTPGHTPEHMSYLVYDNTRTADVPELLLTGDFLFVGSLGRPDLLGEEAKRELANRLFESVRDKLAALPDGLEIHPGHGSGSMCGAGMSGRPMSTLGYERIANPYLQPGLERSEFVAEILGNVPPFPEYYKRMKRLNSEGPPDVHARPAPEGIGVAEFERRSREGHVVVDLRDKESYAGGHIPGSLYVGHRASMWGSWIIPYDTPMLLVAHDREQARQAQVALSRVGLDSVAAYLAGGMDAWEEAGKPFATLAQISPRDLRARLDADESIAILDVRGNPERMTGHIESAAHIVGGEVQDRLDDVPTGESELVVVCNTGFQSTVVSSVLERSGVDNLVNVAGGMTAWREADLPMSRRKEQPVA